MALKTFGFIPNMQEGAVGLPIAQMLYEAKQRADLAQQQQDMQRWITQQEVQRAIDVAKLQNQGLLARQNAEDKAAADRAEESRKQQFRYLAARSGLKLDPNGDPEQQWVDWVKEQSKASVDLEKNAQDKLDKATTDLQDAYTKHLADANTYAFNKALASIKPTWWGNDTFRRNLAANPALLQTDPLYETVLSTYETSKKEFEANNPFIPPLKPTKDLELAKSAINYIEKERSERPELWPQVSKIKAEQFNSAAKKERDELPGYWPESTSGTKAAPLPLPAAPTGQTPPGTNAAVPPGTPGSATTAALEGLGRGGGSIAAYMAAAKATKPVWSAMAKVPYWPVRTAGTLAQYGVPLASAYGGRWLTGQGINAMDPNAAATLNAHQVAATLGEAAAWPFLPLVPRANAAIAPYFNRWFPQPPAQPISGAGPGFGGGAPVMGSALRMPTGATLPPAWPAGAQSGTYAMPTAMTRTGPSALSPVTAQPVPTWSTVETVPPQYSYTPFNSMGKPMQATSVAWPQVQGISTVSGPPRVYPPAQIPQPTAIPVTPWNPQAAVYRPAAKPWMPVDWSPTPAPTPGYIGPYYTRPTAEQMAIWYPEIPTE